MAYGNWGAFVSRDGIRVEDFEDAYFFEGGNLKHAVLGGRDNKVILCGYKCFPSLYVDGNKVDLEPYKTTNNEDYEDNDYEGEIEGYKFSISQYNENMVDMTLIEPDGTVWESSCGFEYGAGHMDC